MPAAVAMFNECLVPICGISMQPSQSKMVSCSTPVTSLPKTRAVLSPSFISNCCNGMLFFTCSMAYTAKPFFSQLPDSFGGIYKMLRSNGFIGAQSCFRNLPVRRVRCVTGGVNSLQQKSVCCAQHAAHIISAANILKNGK